MTTVNYSELRKKISITIFKKRQVYFQPNFHAKVKVHSGMTGCLLAGTYKLTLVLILFSISKMFGIYYVIWSYI